MATYNNVASASRDPLKDGTGFTVTARNTDGYNSVSAQRGISTPVLPAPPSPANPGCSYASTDNVSPGALTINPATGALYRLGSGSWGAARSWSGLGAGTYRGSAYRPGDTNSDGYNTATGPASGISSRVALTVTNPPPPPDPPGYSSTFPANCNGYSVGAAQGTWISNYGTVYVGPTGMKFKVTGSGASGKPTSLAWGMTSERKDAGGWAWTGGVGNCGSGPAGV